MATPDHSDQQREEARVDRPTQTDLPSGSDSALRRVEHRPTEIGEDQARDEKPHIQGEADPTEGETDREIGKE